MTATQQLLPMASSPRLCKLVRDPRFAAFLRRWQNEHITCRTPRRLAYEAARGNVHAEGRLALLNSEWQATAPRELRAYSWASVYDALRRAGLLARRVREHARRANPAASPLPAPAEPESSPCAAAPAEPVLFPAATPSERDLLMLAVTRRLPAASVRQLARLVAVLEER